MAMCEANTNRTPFKIAIDLCGLTPPPWHKGLLRAVVPPQATILWHKDIVYALNEILVIMRLSKLSIPSELLTLKT